MVARAWAKITRNRFGWQIGRTMPHHQPPPKRSPGWACLLCGVHGNFGDRDACRVCGASRRFADVGKGAVAPAAVPRAAQSRSKSRTRSYARQPGCARLLSRLRWWRCPRPRWRSNRPARRMTSRGRRISWPGSPTARSKTSWRRWEVKLDEEAEKPDEEAPPVGVEDAWSSMASAKAALRKAEQEAERTAAAAVRAKAAFTAASDTEKEKIKLATEARTAHEAAVRVYQAAVDKGSQAPKGGTAATFGAVLDMARGKAGAVPPEDKARFAALLAEAEAAVVTLARGLQLDIPSAPKSPGSSSQKRGGGGELPPPKYRTVEEADLAQGAADAAAAAAQGAIVVDEDGGDPGLTPVPSGPGVGPSGA